MSATLDGPKSADKSSKKNPITSWFKKLSSNKSKRAKKDRQQQQRSEQADGHVIPASIRQSEKEPIENGGGREETAHTQRIPSDGVDQTTHPNQVSNPVAPYTLPAPEPSGSFSSLPHTNGEVGEHGSGDHMLESSNKSAAPTVETMPETVNSDAANSKSGTNLAGGGGMSSHSGGGSNSVFSSSNHSSRSLTTTLTTIQSQAPSAHMQNNQTAGQQQAATGAAHGHQTHPSHSSSVYFHHQYPTTPVVSAVPPHVQSHSSPYAPSHLPTTYRSATANNLLTDNASILTLASSTQQQGRRNSLDTTASVRAIAPSSQWGGSRESLPLSMMSQTVDQPSGTGAQHGVAAVAPSRPSIGGIPAQERASIYSGTGNAPVLSSERNSIYTGRTGTAGGASTHNTIASDNNSLKERGGGDELKADDRSSLKAGDGGSVRSGLGGMGHGRNDSIANSIGGSIGPTLGTGAGSSGAGTGLANNSPVVGSARDVEA